MKILSVHNRYRSASPSGEDRVVDQEAEALAAAGHAVERFERSSDDIAALPLARKALVPVGVVWSERSRRSLVRALRSFEPDVVHVHNTFPLLSPSVLYACQAEGIPVVATVHNYSAVCAGGTLFRDGTVCHDCIGRLPLPGVRHGCYRESALATLPLAAGLVVHRRAWRTMISAYVFLSRAQRDIVARDGLPASRVFVKPNFVPRTVAPRADRDDVVVYAGRLTAQKGIDLLLRAWDEYCTSRAPSLRLVIAGVGPLQDRVAAWASTRPSVDCVGMLTRAACTTLISRARAVVVPSVWEEPFGLVVVEAMAAGVPPVAPASGSFPELISHGEDGVLFRPADAVALADVLRDIDEDAERFLVMGRSAHRKYEQHFTPEANMEQLLAIYRFAVDHPTTRSPRT